MKLGGALPIMTGCTLITFATLALSPAVATAGRLGGGGDLGISLGRIISALIICILIALLAALLIRQRSGKTDLRTFFSRFEIRPRAIDVVETRRLSPHADICVVRHGAREYLLLLLSGDARILSETAIAPEAPTETPAPCD